MNGEVRGMSGSFTLRLNVNQCLEIQNNKFNGNTKNICFIFIILMSISVKLSMFREDM